MKKTLSIIFLASSFINLAGADDKDAVKKKEKTPKEVAADLAAAKTIAENKEKLAALNARFGNLPKEVRTDYIINRNEGKRLVDQKRLFEAIIILHELQAVFKDDPYVFNMLGAIHVEFRNFDYARSLFDKSLELTGENPSVLFNLAELSFCENDWEECIKQMDLLLKKWKTKNSAVYKLVEIKYMLAHLALSKDESLNAEKRNAYRKIAEKMAKHHNHMVDSPFHYYAQAALCFADDNSREAFQWIMKAKKVFAKHPKMTSNWDDTFTEFGFLKSHYGDHFSNQHGLSTKALEAEVNP